ncbi:MAG: NAD(P)/FAD-dependent oxidoreductase, partial [Coriobacteriales bacterium]|nr:NAD(P)/FAD-dependent oxidoreductase [Coriobacteriales bacterium]
MAFQVFDVAIVGGGAAGLVAAIAAADGGASVCLIEKGARLGTKLLKTGNGRCNLSNASIEGSLGAVLRSQDVAQCSGGASFYNHPAFVVPTLERFDCLSVCSFFEDLGLLTIADERGWVYPRTRSANSVLDVLVNAVGRREISVLLQHEALRIEPPADGDHFIVRVLDATDHTAADSASASPAQNAAATVIRASRVIVATGALGEQALAELTTLDTLPCVPILGPLKTEVKPIRGLNGVRVMASIRLQGSAPAEYGEILFRDYGLSGIAVFNLSRFVQQGQTLSLDFFPELSAVELLDRLKARTEKLSAPSASSFFDGMLHRRLAVILLRRCGL